MVRHEEINHGLQQAVQGGSPAQSVPGVAALAIAGSEVVYEAAFGVRSPGVAMTPDTVFNIASMTKAITAVACMQLVEQGRIGLDDDVGAVVPALASPRVIEGFDDGDRPILRPARRAVTLRHLMTHTSGLSYETWSPVIMRYMRHTGHSRLDTFRRPADVIPLAFDPGERWAYGFGMEWTGKIIEALTGDTLEAYLHAHVFDPLGMTSTGYRVTPAMAARLVTTYARRADGSLEPLDLSPPTDPETFMGGGGLHSTAGDYGRFLLMLGGGGTLGGVRMLKPETVALMGENHIGDTDVAGLRSGLPDMSNDVEFFPGVAKRWGISFMINTHDVPGGRRAGSLCWAGLRNTYYWLDPRAGVAGIVMTQILPFGDRAALELFETFERAVYRAVAG